jgi:hypothetical protein
MEINFDFAVYVLMLPNDQHIEATIFLADRTVRVQATLANNCSGVILATSPRRVFCYDPATFSSDLEFFTAEFERQIGLDLPVPLFDQRHRVRP